MKPEQFQREKQEFLNKPDKSRKGSIDEKIRDLLDIINSIEYFYTTSSCSGRAMVYIPGKRKQETVWVFTSHEEINNSISKYQGVNHWFKTEGPIIHLVAIDLEKAREIIELFRLNGWKKTGIISLKHKIVVEASTSLLINQPFNELSSEYIELLVNEANKKLRKGWEFIDRAKTKIREKYL